MPLVAALTLLNVKLPLLSWKAPIATASIGQQQPERHVHAERDDPCYPPQPAEHVQWGQPGRRPGRGSGTGPGGPGIRDGSRGPEAATVWSTASPSRSTSAG